jgi:hypothetical protein
MQDGRLPSTQYPPARSQLTTPHRANACAGAGGATHLFLGQAFVAQLSLGTLQFLLRMHSAGCA